MNHLTLPGTDLEISRFAMGTADMGTGIEEDRAFSVLDLYAEQGGSFLDTAHCYACWMWEGKGEGESEKLVAKWLKTRGAKDFVVATKGGHSDIGVASYSRRDAFLGPEQMEEDLTESLERLEADCVDIYYYHRDDPRMTVEELVDFMADLVSRGLIKLPGASNWSLERLAAANAYAEKSGKPKFVILQNQWSLATPNWSNDGIGDVRCLATGEGPALAELGVPVAAWSPTAAGWFADKKRWGTDYDTAENESRKLRAIALAEEWGVSATVVALAWLLSQPCQVVPILGTGSPVNLLENIKALEFVERPELAGLV